MRRPNCLTGLIGASALGVLAAGLLSGMAAAQVPVCNAVPCTETHTVAVATQAPALEHSFTVNNAGTYQIALTDLGAQLTPPAPLTSLQMAVTTGTTLVGTPLVGAGSVSITANAAGTYVLHIIGTPGAGIGSGPVGTVVTASGGSQVDAFSGTLSTPQQALPSSEALLNDSFTVSTAGNYTITLTDLDFQQPLAAAALLVVEPGGASPIPLALPGGGPPLTASTTATLQPGTYDVFAVGETAASASSGLYSVEITSPTGATTYGNTVSVGGATLLGSPTLGAATYTLTSTDLAVPVKLTQLYAMAVQNGQSVASLTAAGTTSFTAAGAGGTYQVFAAGVPGATGTGSYAVQLAPQAGGAANLSVARPVLVHGSPTSAFSYDASASSAGAYTATFTDFGFPAQLGSLTWAIAQGGTVLAQSSNAIAVNFNAASGPLSAVVFVQPGATGGLFNLVADQGSGSTPLIDATQAVGTLVSQRQISITTAGTYQVTASDLGFPSNLQNLYVAVTHETQPVGSIFGTGSFNFSATPGTYYVNFLAEPTGSADYGTYALQIQTAPPAPTVSLSADATTVASGGTVHLIWSTQNATSCTASGGWMGSEPVSGTATSPAITSNTTFTLSCTGPGGTTMQSVSVTVSATQSGHGGGSVDPLLVAALVALLVARRRGALVHEH